MIGPDPDSYIVMQFNMGTDRECLHLYEHAEFQGTYNREEQRLLRQIRDPIDAPPPDSGADLQKAYREAIQARDRHNLDLIIRYRDSKLRRLFLKRQPELITLQEHIILDRLENVIDLARYQIVVPEDEKEEGNRDAAVIFDRNRFELLTLHPRLERTDAVVVDLFDRIADTPVRVISMHVPGCDPVSGENADRGNEELDKVLEIALQNAPERVIFGADMNVGRQVEGRFRILEERGFKLDPFQGPTAMTTIGDDRTPATIKLDYVATLSKNVVDFVRPEINRPSLMKPLANASDHHDMTLVLKMKPVSKKSRLRKIISGVGNFFKKKGKSNL